MAPVKVLIIDDSAVARQTFKSLLESDPDVMVIGTAGDPYIAVQKIQKERPDVITLDIEMPRMDGITFLGKLMKQAPMPVVVISNQTAKGAEVALQALEIGAVDVLQKPDLSSPARVEESRVRLVDAVKSASMAVRKKQIITTDQQTATVRYTSNAIIAVGASTGGTEAIRTFLEPLPPTMPPILIVQHMPEKFTASFAARLDKICQLRVKEASDNELIEAGSVYIAPGNQHMSLVQSGMGRRIRIAQGDLVNRHRPSVNVLFNSVAAVAGKAAIGILLTGMGDDGATGMLRMFEKGAFTIAQDESTSVVFGMPQKAILAGGVSRVLPLHQISGMVSGFLNDQQENAR